MGKFNFLPIKCIIVPLTAVTSRRLLQFIKAEEEKDTHGLRLVKHLQLNVGRVETSPSHTFKSPSASIIVGCVCVCFSFFLFTAGNQF